MFEPVRISRKLNPDQIALTKKILGEIERPEIKAVNLRMDELLVLLPFSEYYDIFMLMEDDFKSLYIGKSSFTELRTEAQEEAERKTQKSGKLTIDLIYDILMKKSKISSSSRDQLLKRECELYIYFAYPREFGKDIFNKAKENRKKVIITADIPYPRNIAVNILSKCGYESCDELIITSELSSEERNDIFGTVVKRSGVTADKILNIGTDVVRDVEKPIMQGAKALLVSPVDMLMVKSGNLRCAVQARHIYDYESPSHLALHCAFGIYADYGFDVPQNRQPHSDFCNDGYMTGFMVYGPLQLIKGFKPENKLQAAILDAMEKCPETRAGRDDFVALFRSHFADFLDKFGYSSCDLPFDIFTYNSSVGDRMLLQKYMSAEDNQEWTDSSAEPSVAPVQKRKLKKNAMEKLADRMFPPGTRVRNITDDVIYKMKGGK